MKACARPGCPELVYAGETACYYCSKVRDGLIAPSEHFARTWTIRQQQRTRKVPTVSTADVMTDEQRELAALMRSLGATEHVIQRALAKELRRGGGKTNSGHVKQARVHAAGQRG